tara:strand:+ start:374 stop:1822 length:1449 start_codon:yes stop_codon:yes gene_type:complete
MKIPKEIQTILGKLEKKGFQAFLVGGCVRDLLRKVEPKDWDITTDARPEEIEKCFSKTFSENEFGTVTVLTGSKDPSLANVEITPFRTEEKYTDKRHPDKVEWADNVEQDLARRDFTVNSVAMDKNLKIVDPFDGQKDLKKKIIKAVGKAEDRLEQDALRMIRAVRFGVVFDFEIEKKTKKAIKDNAPWLQAISKERVRDELVKIIMSDRADQGIELLRELKLLQYIIPELEEGLKIKQNKHHVYDCFEHAVLSLKYASKQSFNIHVRLASLLHDIAKPRVKKGRGQSATFYNHEIVGAKMTSQILNRLKFSKKDIEKIVKLVRFHLFYYNVDEVGEASVRKLVRRVGIENMEELIQVRMADRIGSGVPKAEPYKLRHLKYLVEKVSKDPISVRKLKISGDSVMKILKIEPGPKIGWILDILLDHVLTDPKNNDVSFLEKETKKLGKLSDKVLRKQSKESKEERYEIEKKEDNMTKKKYWVT